MEDTCHIYNCQSTLIKINYYKKRQPSRKPKKDTSSNRKYKMAYRYTDKLKTQ